MESKLLVRDKEEGFVRVDDVEEGRPVLAVFIADNKFK